MFINLNVHSQYSLMSSTMSIERIIRYAKEQNKTHACLVDINVMYGAMEFYQKSKQEGLIPIIGLQIIYHDIKMVLIAKNYKGYNDLIHISSYINTHKTFNINHYFDNLFIITQETKSQKWFKANRNDLSDFSNKDDEIAMKEVFFERKDDIRYLKALWAIREGKQIEDFKNNNDHNHFYMSDDIEANKIYSKKALHNLEEIINVCVWEMPNNQTINFVQFDKTKDSKQLLSSLCLAGLKKRIPHEQIPKQYLDRLHNELEVINTMKFNDYFLVVQDYVNYARKNNILVGPGRGSAAGSLVAYALNITSIDPIENNLIFERFLNIERTSMPDIDIDFMDSKRNEVIKYIFDKYSPNNVAHIVIFQRLKAKMAIRDVGRALGIDLSIINLICKLISVDFELDIPGAINKNEELKKYAHEYHELFDIANKFIDTPRQFGLHAAGIVITNTPLDDIVPIQTIEGGLTTTQYSMEYLENIGVIKMDILGLNNLTIIDETLNLIRTNYKKNIDLNTINLHDQKIFNTLSNGDTIGIFQLESPGMRTLIKKIKPTCIEDISITSALFRPGPQKNIPIYLENKNNPKAIKYINDDFKKVLESTYNVIVYQEQVIEIVQRVSKFTLAQSDVFRRAISKKDVDKLINIKKSFLQAAKNNNYSESEANKIYDFIFMFANYGFNHSHSLAYSYISYWMAYLKYYYVLEYFCVLLSASINNVDKISEYVNELRSRGHHVLPPYINEADFNFQILNKNIYFGLGAIKGLGIETVNKIINVKKNNNYNNFKNYMQAITLLVNGGITQKQTEILIKAGSFDKLLEKENKTRNYLLYNLEEIFTKVKTMTSDGNMLIQPNLKEIEETKQTQQYLFDEQFNLLGVSFIEHPLTKLKSKLIDQYQFIDLKQISQHEVIKSLVKLNSYREIRTKTNSLMAFIKFEDDTKVCDAAIFPGLYLKIKSDLKNNDIYLITIKNSEKGLSVLDLRKIELEKYE